MRAYEVTCTADSVPQGRRRALAGTMAEAVRLKRCLMEDFGLKRAAIDTEEVEVPITKAELINYINKLINP
jgi:hypothetical protein